MYLEEGRVKTVISVAATAFGPGPVVASLGERARHVPYVKDR